MNRTVFALSLSTLFLSWLGCGYSYVATTPGARPLVLQSPEVAGEGNVAIAGQATYRNESDQDTAQESYLIGSGSVRIGVGANTELQLEAQYRGGLGRPVAQRLDVPAGTVVPSLRWTDMSDRNGIAGRAGFRVALPAIRGNHFAAIGGGVGVGALSSGTFLAPELVFTGGFENDVIVPFANVRVGVGVPIGARLTLEGRDANDVAQFFRPQYETTFFVTTDIGARVPLVHDGGVRPSLLFGFGIGYDFRLTDSVSGTTRPPDIAGPVGTAVIQAGLALELAIGADDEPNTSR